MAGRKPKPTHLKVVQGTLEPSRANKREPMLPPGIPACPKDETTEVRQHYADLARQIGPMNIATEADRDGLVLMARLRHEVVELEAALRLEGRVYETFNQSGGRMVRSRPEVVQLAEARRMFIRMLVEFGLTPSSRSKVQSLNAPDEDEGERFLGTR